VVTTTATTSLPAGASRPASGARSGAVLAASALVATALNYAFLLAAGRLLGSDDYGALAALLGLLTVVLLPTGAVQLAVSREVSRRIALGDDAGADAFGRATLRLGLLATAPLVVLALALVVPLRELLNIESTAPVVLTAAGLVVALVFPIATGVLLGYQRFHAVAAMYVLPFALRLGLLAIVAILGYRLGGVVLAAVLGGAVSAAVAVALLRDPLRRGVQVPRPALGSFLRYLWPVLVGLIGIAVLTNVDVLVVKARFSGDAAGEYAAASAFARVAFFLPATILAVLFPRTAARQARGESTADILGRSVLVAAAFCSLLTLFYAMTGPGLVRASFGAEFENGGDLLVPFTVSMSLFSLANVLVGFHLSQGERRYAWIVAAAVPAQVAVLALVPDSVRGVIWADVAVGVALLAAHELFVESSVPALRSGLQHLRQGVHIARGAVVEAVLVLVGTTALVCVLFWRIVAHLGSAFVGSEGSDASGTVAWFWRLQREGGYHVFGTTHHVLTGAPIGWNEGNGLNLQLLLVYYPGYLAAKVVGEVAAFNLVVVSGYILSGVAMYVLTRYLGCNQLVSAWAAVVFVVFPWHLARAEHASFLHLEILVLLALALVAAAERPSGRRFLIVALATLACWLTGGYLGAMAAVGAVAFAFAAAATERPRQAAAKLAGGLAAAAVAGTVAIAIFATAGHVGPAAGLNREITDLRAYGLRLNELVVPPGDNLVLGDRLASYHQSRMHLSNPTETSNYLGLLTLALAFAWLVLAWRRRASIGRRARIATAGLAGVFVASIAFALPNPVSILGTEFSWMPSRILWDVLPAFRVPSRWTALAMTALVPLAALGLQAVWSALAGHGRRIAGVALAPAAVVVVAVIFSFLELHIDPTKSVFDTRAVPPQYAAVTHTQPGILAEYPLRRSDIYTMWQRVHGRPLLDGAADGTYANDVRLSLVDPRSPGTPPQLALLGVTSMVTRTTALDYEENKAPERPNASWGAGYELVQRFPDGSSVWKVSASPAPALSILAGADFALPVFRNGFFAYPLIAPAGHIELMSPTSHALQLQFDARSTDGVRRTLTMTGANDELTFPISGWTRISASVRVPQGRSVLALTFDPAPSELDVELTAPWTGPASTQPLLQAFPTAATP
jgi:O-antigen/teichoic acid export membrane protein